MQVKTAFEVILRPGNIYKTPRTQGGHNAYALIHETALNFNGTSVDDLRCGKRTGVKLAKGIITKSLPKLGQTTMVISHYAQT